MNEQNRQMTNLAEAPAEPTSEELLAAIQTGGAEQAAIEDFNRKFENFCLWGVCE